MKILLVNPSFCGSIHNGLAMISAYLKQNSDHTVAGFEVMKDGELQPLFGRIEAVRPDLIGVSCISTGSFRTNLDYLRLIKERFPRLLTLIGGAHVTSNPHDSLAPECVDYVAVGEGEITTLELLNALSGKGRLSDILGLGYKKDGQPVLNEERPFIEDLDSLPMQDLELFDMGMHLRLQQGRKSYNMRTPSATMVTTRGCPMNCVYCSIRKVWKGVIRKRSPESVVREIQTLTSRYGIREIHFLDDNFTFDRRRVIDICDRIVEAGLDIRWTTPNGVAIWTLDETALDRMKKAGCYRLTFGLESGDPETKKFIRKNYDLDRAKELIRYANRIGIWTVGTFIIGFPYEKRESIMNTIRYSIDADLDGATFYTATPFPGTDLYEICKKEGIAVPEEASLFKGGVDSLHFTRDELRALREMAHKQFYRSRLLRGHLLLHKVKSAEDLRYLAKVSRNILQTYATGFKSFFR